MSDRPARVPEANGKFLNKKQRMDYETHREDFLECLSTFGMDPDTVQGYAEGTVYKTAYRCGKFDRFVWDRQDGYTLPTPDHADAYMKHLAYEDYSGSHKANTKDALARYFKWRHYEFGEDEWEPDFTFSKDTNVQPPDFLSEKERQQLRQTALNYGSIPSYSGLDSDERNKWKRHVAQVLRKPIEDVGPDDWDRVNGWKFTSIVWASLDAGLRPAEVGKAKTGWVDTENQLLRIPASESTKNADNWQVSIRERTANVLERWLDERENYRQYEDTDAMWLTREGNPYGPQSLRRLLIRLCEDASIETENRKMSWYAIRHSVGTYMAREEDLAAAQAQLRHKSVQTTMKYDAAPLEDRQKALDRMG